MYKDQLAKVWAFLRENPLIGRGISITVLLLCFCILAYKGYQSWDSLQEYEWQIRYVRLIPSFGLFLIQLAVIVWGWQLIMKAMGSYLPFHSHIKIYGYTNLIRRIPAGMLWMVAGRTYAYQEQKVPARVSALGSVIEMLVVVLTGLPICAYMGYHLELYPLSVGIVLSIAALAIEIGAVHPTILGKLTKLAEHVPVQASLTYRTTLSWAMIYTLVWLISGIGLFAVAAIFADISLASLPVTIGIWVLSSEISYITLLSPSGLGIKELSLTVLLGTLLPDPLPLIIALGIRIIWTIYDLAIGVISFCL